jgi:hypothetical protein
MNQLRSEEKSMSNKVGLWIDHRKAVIVTIAERGEAIKQIDSDIEKHVRSSGGSRSKTPYGPQDVSAEDIRDRKFLGHLNKYFDEVMSSLHTADSILIFGPGEAKGELKKRLGKKLKGVVITVDTADKMTVSQIAAKVREHFQK